ncbi:hypothetical protein RGQ29_030188 [Quercus rubra]|uniref:Endonuclease/exonuclease/phosphatase domain-containing protein n=1 Tax=Quercus rubra TaxID=3512 RepID=A0AAN7EHB9_QUERU|nr:hypothetical protein RGQ29_030188 [Quercus rubra]
MISWNVRGYDPRKRLVVKNLMRKWKCDVVCLQETKIASMNRQLVCSLWGCPYVDWAVLKADQIAGSILIIWDKRVLNKVEVLVGTFSVSRIPWCCFGDFNIVRFPSECRGETRSALAMEKFSEFIEDLNLIDLPLEGGSYTWSSGTDQPAMSRIDRALVSLDWEDHFPDVIQRILPHPISDHSPILLEAWGMAKGKSPFRFENMWLKTEEFLDKVQSWWNHHSFVERQKNQLMEELKSLDAKEGELGLSDREKSHRVNLRSQVEHLLSLEEISWRQKSRMLCITEGDNNTKFFHRMANSYRRYNHLRALEVDGVVFEEESEVSNQVVQFYKNLYKESEGWRPFVEEEILQVVSDMEGDKAPGPDGFTMAFYQHCWKVVEKDVLAVFEEVFHHCKFEKSLNATFLVLIPKKNDASDIRDFQPISLVGSVYKILAKVLANRLRMVLNQLISETQNSFVAKGKVGFLESFVNLILKRPTIM